MKKQAGEKGRRLSPAELREIFRPGDEYISLIRDAKKEQVIVDLAIDHPEGFTQDDALEHFTNDQNIFRATMSRFSNQKLPKAYSEGKISESVQIVGEKEEGELTRYYFVRIEAEGMECLNEDIIEVEQNIESLKQTRERESRTGETRKDEEGGFTESAQSKTHIEAVQIIADKVNLNSEGNVTSQMEMLTSLHESDCYQAFRNGLKWLIEQQGSEGGWGDSSTKPDEVVTGHVVYSLSALGLDQGTYLNRARHWLDLSAKTHPEWVVAWYDSLLFDEERLPGLLSRNYLSAISLLYPTSTYNLESFTRAKLSEAVEKWTAALTARPEPFLQRHGCWILLAAAEALRCLEYEGELWDDIEYILQSIKKPDSDLWEVIPEEVAKDTGQAIQSLLRLPSFSKTLVRKATYALAGMASQTSRFAFWQPQEHKSVRGTFFITRWALLGLLEALEDGLLDDEFLPIVEKSIRWLAHIQRVDGAWAEIDTEPTIDDPERHNRLTGPGFVIYAVVALGKWLQIGSGIKRSLVEKEMQKELHQLLSN